MAATEAGGTAARIPFARHNFYHGRVCVFIPPMMTQRFVDLYVQPAA